MDLPLAESRSPSVKCDDALLVAVFYANTRRVHQKSTLSATTIMAKDKVTTKERKNQPKLTNFFQSSKKAGDGSESDASDNGAPNSNQAVSRANNKLPPDQSDLPPINDIPRIFSDLVNRVPKIQDVVERIRGRKLRVATMCSGTESPLLALNLICRSIKERYGTTMEIEHIFSCEIEPFKQAYIERNFKPPILFRDVCELGGEYA